MAGPFSSDSPLGEWVADHKGLLSVLAIAAGAILVVVVVWSGLKDPANSANFPEGTQWICKNGHQFTMTIKQLAAHHEKHFGQAVPCPTCGADAERAIPCPHCGTLVAAHDARGLCPKCKKPMQPKP